MFFIIEAILIDQVENIKKFEAKNFEVFKNYNT